MKSTEAPPTGNIHGTDRERDRHASDIGGQRRVRGIGRDRELAHSSRASDVVVEMAPCG